MGILPPKKSIWHIVDESGNVVSGDFEPQNVTKNVSSTYTETFALGRQSPIMQFLHGNVETLSFEGRFFLDPNVLIGIPFVGGIGSQDEPTPEDKLETLLDFTRVDAVLRRPPIVTLYIGDEDTFVDQAIIESISNIRYDRPLPGGGVRGVTFTVNLKKFTPFKFEIVPPARTRYHKVKEGEYYELLAVREYNSPLMGSVIRHENPKLQVPKPGDTIPLPSREAIISEPTTPTSTPLKTLTSNQQSPQQLLARDKFISKNKPFFSTVIPEGL